jgi:DNA-binding winged helix-turn-helix (wHTH) protein
LESAHFYSFGPFCLDTAKHILSRDGEPIPLQPKAYEVLLMLIENRNRLVKRTELQNSVWKGVNVGKGALGFQIRQLRKILGEVAFKPQYIRTIPSVGFRFIADVQALSEFPERSGTTIHRRDTDTSNNGGDSDHEIARPVRLVGVSPPYLTGHLGYVLVANAVYAAYFGVALLVEVAYQFNRYRRPGVLIAMMISCFVYLSSVFGLSIGARRTVSGKPGGLLLSASVFLLAAAVVLVGATRFLPAEPITEANFQTFTAQAAYVKDLCYIVPLGLIFLVAPFNFVIAMERELQSTNPVLAVNLLTGTKPNASPKGTVFLRTWFLILLLSGMLVYSLIARAHLFDNLKAGSYMGFFQTLIHIRMILYFGLAILCVAWYYRALDGLKWECFARDVTSNDATASQLS